MYTPGSTSPQQARANRKSTRFSRTASSAKPQQNLSQSYLLPSNMPNTSQIMPDHGPLPNIQVHYNVPADEKQIVASLRALQRDLAEAMQTITSLTRERDEAVQELRLIKANPRKPSSPPKRQTRNIEDELFDLSSPIQHSPEPPTPRQPQSKKESRDKDQKQTQVSDEARVISQRDSRDVNAASRFASIRSTREGSKQHKQPIVEDTEQSIVEDNPTAASNTSRRRRRASLDDNMTSAYILPDITMEDRAQEPIAKVSQAAQSVLHSLDPEHINNCDVCHRLTKHIRAADRQNPSSSKAPSAEPISRIQDFASTKQATPQPDYTAAVAGFLNDSYVGDATMRPKIPPSRALMQVKILMDAQFRKAKERHRLAWERYDRIDAPLSSRKHAEISKEMQHWAEKMEECRVHLDYLRDVEEGMTNEEEQ